MRPRLALLVGSLFFLTLSSLGAAGGTTWSNGDEITYNQPGWGTDPGGIVTTNYNHVYAGTGGVFEVGIPGSAGFSIMFDDGVHLVAYLPAVGTPAALDADVINPTTTASGSFGGEVVALKLNIDFSDAELTLGASKIPFGDLFLENFNTLPNLNGLTIRQFLGDVNILLGGGTSIYDIATLDAIAADINASFGGGDVTMFAQDHLVAPTSAVPEPSTLVLVGSGLAGLVAGFRRQRPLV